MSLCQYRFFFFPKKYDLSFDPGLESSFYTQWKWGEGGLTGNWSFRLHVSVIFVTKILISGKFPLSVIYFKPPTHKITHTLLCDHFFFLFIYLFIFKDADRGERMFESGAVPSQDGAGRGADGEGLAAAPHEEPQIQHQLGSAPSSQRASRSAHADCS